MQKSILNNDPLWYKNAIIYEVPVRAFADSNGDGIGDFRGLTEKLDYLQDLGVTALWVLPFFPSPLKDDGYDIASYTSVNPIYGTLEDFKDFLEAAHKRGIRVIIELIVNHTSDQHPWFQRARRAPKGSQERDFYVWSDTPEKYQEARIIFQDFETSNWTWDPIAKAYYWHRFYSHQPDLNYDNPNMREAVFEVLDFWLEMGVDGLRLDAVPYLYERDGTNCENLPETHAVLKELRARIDEKFPNRMLLAEANQWPEDAAQYYGAGDECHMNFHFPLMPRLFMALRMEDNFPIVDIIQQTPPIPDNCQWALFLRNHDELTLEMVTDEDRDYMYRVYAQDPVMRVNLGIRRRLAPLLGNDRRQIELLTSLLLSLPGTPVLYYGDEIGMGDNVFVGDRNGVRTPMQWSSDRNAGFSRANPQRMYLPVIVDSEYHYEAVNVEAQRANPNSLWYAMKRLIATRKRFQALGKGNFELLSPNNRKVLTFTRTYEDERILVVANLSKFVQTVELDLSNFEGLVPVEIFGQTEFPPIGESPYFLSLSPYGFYWFTLQRKHSLTQPPKLPAELPTLFINSQWQHVFSQTQSIETRTFVSQLEAILSDYLYTCSWFGGKTQTIQSARITEAIPVPYKKEGTTPCPAVTALNSGGQEPTEALILWLQVDYIEGNPETYLLLLAYTEGEQAMELLTETPQAVVARLQIEGHDEVGVLFSAVADKDFLTFPLDAIFQNRSYKGIWGEVVATATDLFNLLCDGDSCLDPVVLKGEQNNTYVIYSDRLFLKFFRKIEEGIHPDLETRRFLSQRKILKHFAAIAGALEYRRPTQTGVGSVTLGILQEFIPNTRSGWNYTLDSLQDYFELVTTQHSEITDVPVPSSSLLDLQPVQIPELVQQTIGSYVASAQLLAQSTAEIHIALASSQDNPDFAPEPFSSLYQRSIYQYARNTTGQVFRLLADRLHSLPPETQTLAKAVLDQQQEILNRFQLVLNHKITAMRTRYHGDYHLGRVLYTGKDFIIFDFEGREARTLNERRMKRSPLRDVAGMLISFNYAVSQALRNEKEKGMIRDENLPLMEKWSDFWYTWVTSIFLNSYLKTAAQDSFLPKTKAELQVLLDFYLLEKLINALGNELNNRPEWVQIPLQLLARESHSNNP
ncbi:maltose alpha-D-glucosyltransferase [Aetokthonos hydrillicola Thurmond2011]|jgi:maltose alpha-D-glucosyltransferase/alpha-amylase|uniref:maltose alpha-D-glucosyltransferase n=1 Tax=Aetokthonos hydrillicola Thurmond2011 TaxID=2712845 RepID=A0AAP5IAR1_9CYAN|nr:maltose alpha-D-glucosyltransferase [Aetokthonos hydrillicola]MBO3460409.1 maltose alpha-D-glucosyltransferase [Aetokthonos hydrillicola CCALA 1050]MBW4588515.1 maltose alpha-D-glucosyltransferase [Aetokthonos hydrillicola CCALA 1050]MDR9896844.1 maltose alpha-D-glucosyltransferase [Aetokthonos hydrillicola Thurmond2011]